jgi:diguanylate cyclase (GGDEF)-like protein
MEQGHAQSVTASRRSKNGGKPKPLRNLVGIPLGASALVLCVLALVMTLEAPRDGLWLYVAMAAPCLAFGASFLAGAAVSTAWKTTEEKEIDPKHVEWVRPLFDSLTGIWLVREPGDDVKSAIALAIETLASGVGLGEAWVFFADQSEDGLGLVAHCSAAPKGGQIELPDAGMSMARQAVQSRLPVESTAFPHVRRFPDLTHTEARMVPALAVPLRSRDRTWGVLVVAGQPGHSLSRDQRQVVTTFSDMLAMTFEATLLYDEVRRNRDEMNALFQIAMDITSHLQLEELLGAVVRRTVTLLDGLCGGVRLIERTISSWEYGHTTFWPVDEGNSEAILALERQTEDVVEYGRSKVIEIPSETVSTSDDPGEVGKAAGVIVPMKWGGEVIGVLYVLLSPHGRGLAETDASLLSLLASQAAIAVENCRLYESCHVLAVTDPLTGLYNRRLFSEQLAKETSRSAREGAPLSIIVLDVDGLKEFNDSRGHQEGDRALCEIASILQHVTRESDIASRYGGDEFAVLLPAAVAADAVEVAERIRSELESRRMPDPGISVSIGLATYPSDALDAENLMLTADRRLYTAKRLGGNRVCGATLDSPDEHPLISLN